MTTRLMLIDDDAAARRMMRRILERRGYVVEEAGDGRTGLEAIRAAHPAGVILDLRMPGELSGLDVARELRSDPATATIPIIIVSSKNMETDRVWGLRQGAKDYLVKPPAERDLITRINALLDAVS